MSFNFNEQWVILLNNAPAVNTTATTGFQSAVLQFKRALCGQAPNNLLGAWRVIGSSNGIVANTTDNWQSNGDIIANTSGNAHSWIQLRSPSGFLPGAYFVDLIINCNITDNASVQLKFANSNNPYDVTTGSILVSPGNGAEPTNSYQITQVIRTASTAAQKMHFWRTQSGIFLAGFSVDGTGVMERAIGCFTGTRMGDRDQTDNFCAALFAAADNTNGVFKQIAQNAGMSGWWTDGVKHANGLSVPMPTFTSPSALGVYSNGTGRSLISGNRIGFPFDLYAVPYGSSPQSTQQAYRGRIPDMLLGPAAQSSNVFADNDTSAALRLLSVQQFWMPVDNNQTVTL